MTQSINLKFDLVMHNQAHKEITVNEALIKIDMLMNNCVLELQCNTPVKEILSGDMYIIGSEPTIPEWKNKKDYLTYYYINQWYFIEPKTGLTVWLKSKNQSYTYNNAEWIPTYNTYTK
ncbi:hypothetical protein EHRUM4_04000 [Ehrlichia ruminantium]|uniref:DUF2793 domain-containing protein n=1 Tax=Ehrlichia ruminantium TaxID=779 RepID=A0A161M722_EHRRU|nr:DUF2793 domain-containing protein [Ehrlichia ruminantium]GAT75192.1 hypothetical protein EHRUM4_04000 [Ehrlichia ruminantium]GAT77182.1 hypothetical protein EHRUM2_03930 [Ehrlichia ruminantium]GAT78269.1 hypothetical protein EHRUM3_04830 [Ehrlichia ruminantium]